MYDHENIRRAAHSMIHNHGSHAAEIAAKRAFNLPGDTLKESREIWEDILDAIYSIEGDR